MLTCKISKGRLNCISDIVLKTLTNAGELAMRDCGWSDKNFVNSGARFNNSCCD